MFRRTLALAFLALVIGPRLVDAGELKAAFGEADITPALKDDEPVWLAGYSPGREATGVHDPLMARCVLLDDGKQKIALVSVDLIGLQYPAVKAIRSRLKDISYVLVSSTHNHEGPDVIGIWGKTFVHRGVDDDYLRLVVDRIVKLIDDLSKDPVGVTASYGTARDVDLLHDSRQPVVFDDVLRVLLFTRTDDGKTAGVLVQWSCHPEALGSRNTLITADFPHATVAALTKKYHCPVSYFAGAVGGLMAPPSGRFKNKEGKPLKDGDFEFADDYGRRVADVAAQAIEKAKPIDLTPLAVSARPIYVPVENPYYRTAHALGVLRRAAYVWTGDMEERGKPFEAEDATKLMAVETEVAYLRLGQLDVAGIPGEIYPELVYGKYQEPADPGADFPDAPLEKSVVDTLPAKRWLLLGLANDEIGYIIPRRQWDSVAPFAYGRKKSQYGEINSCGSTVAPLIMKALNKRIEELGEP